MRLIDFMREFPDEQICERYCLITMHLLTSTKKAFLAAAILSVILTIILPLPWPAIFLISFSSYIILNLLIR